MKLFILSLLIFSRSLAFGQKPDSLENDIAKQISLGYLMFCGGAIGVLKTSEINSDRIAKKTYYMGAGALVGFGAFIMIDGIFDLRRHRKSLKIQSTTDGLSLVYKF